MKLVHTDLIIKYTDNELSKNECLNFEKNLLSNSQLRQELKLHKHLDCFMKRRFKLEKDAENDSFYNEANKFAINAISDYVVDNKNTSEITDFTNVNINLSKREKEKNQNKQLNDIDHIARNWVNKWNEELDGTNPNQKYLDDIKLFVVEGMNLNKKGTNQQKLLKVVSKKSNNRIKAPFFNNWYYSVASAAAMFLISFGLWKVIDKPMGSDELFVSFYEPYNLVYDQTRGSNDVPEAYTEALSLYMNENYREAAVIYKKALDSNMEQVDIRFLYAISLIELKKYEEAIVEFEKVILNYDSYNLESKWYLSLCYLKLNRPEEAQEFLLELSEKRSYYQESAKEIMEQLN